MDRESMIGRPNIMKDKKHSGTEIRYFSVGQCLPNSIIYKNHLKISFK